MGNYYKTIFDYIISISYLGKEHFFEESQAGNFIKKLQEDTADYPVVILSEGEEYFGYNNQDNVILENEIRTGISFNLEIVSNNIDDIIKLEELYTNRLSNNYNLSKFSMEHSTKNASIVKKNTEVKRKNLSDNKYGVAMLIDCNGILLQKEIEYPVRFELNQNTQIKILKHLALLENVYYKLSSQLNNSTSEDEKNKIEGQLKSLETQISDMFIFKNLCDDRFSLKNRSFQYCYQLMKNNKIDIKTAISYNSQKIKKEEDEQKKLTKEKLKAEKAEAERIEKMRKQFSKSGDTQLNRFTDSVVEHIKRNLSTDFDVSVYGGSTFNEWYRLFEERKIAYPNILIFETMQYSTLIKEFQNESLDSKIVSHNYNTIALPIKYGISVRIFTNNKEQADSIEKQILNTYSIKNNIKIPDINFEGENTIIYLQVDNDNEVERKEFGIIHRRIMEFNSHISVYYVRPISSEECANNQRFQLRVLQQSEYMMVKHNQIAEAKRNLNTYYKPLIERKRSLLGSVFGLLDSAEYKQVKNLYNNNMPINKDLFDSAFKNIVKVYPELYQNFMNGWSYEQIEKSMDELMNYYKSRYNLLLDTLNIPKNIIEILDEQDEKLTKMGWAVGPISGPNVISVRTLDRIQFYIDKMGDPYCVLEDLYYEFRKKKKREIEAQRERERREREERAARREEEYYERGGSSGGIFSTAIGVALGNKMSGGSVNKKSRNGKVDLWGTAACPYGERMRKFDPKSPSFATISCNMSCPKWGQCSRA